jgi:hypothetical protein
MHHVQEMSTNEQKVDKEDFKDASVALCEQDTNTVGWVADPNCRLTTYLPAELLVPSARTNIGWQYINKV